MTRCKKAARLRQAWYETATKLYGGPGDAQKMLDDRANPEYQEALRLYREHLRTCEKCVQEMEKELKSRRMQ